MENEYYPFINLPLPYKYHALEPFIDTKTMFLHHDRHLQTYIDNLNKALRNHPKLQALSLPELILTAPGLSGDLSDTIRNNAGGVFNHRFYFHQFTNPARQEPEGTLASAIRQTFGSFEEFKNRFKQAALSVFGSGYAWLVSHNGKLMIITTANQNCPIEDGYTPVLTIDVWEHAYYLKHYNLRAKYIDDWFMIINWPYIEHIFLNSVSSR